MRATVSSYGAATNLDAAAGGEMKNAESLAKSGPYRTEPHLIE
jgi:hypothetical protein